MATCRSCPAEIEWAISAKTGKPMPLDKDPVPKGDGNLVVVGRQADGAPIVQFARKGYGDRVAHFATCPNASKHRSK